MTPFEIDILLWYHCRAEDHPVVTDGRARQEGLARETIQSFLDRGLLRLMAPRSDMQPRLAYALTDRGDAYCRALQLVPLPDARWHVDWPQWTPEVALPERPE